MLVDFPTAHNSFFQLKFVLIFISYSLKNERASPTVVEFSNCE